MTDNPEIGSFNQLTFHPLSGKVVSKDETTLVVCDFVYDGKGPDAFFIVGNKDAADKPNAEDAIPGKINCRIFPDHLLAYLFRFSLFSFSFCTFFFYVRTGFFWTSLFFLFLSSLLSYFLSFFSLLSFLSFLSLIYYIISFHPNPGLLLHLDLHIHILRKFQKLTFSFLLFSFSVFLDLTFRLY